ncbi:MAG: hypothetical protein QM703_21625 [Gemmatales bacterium]
MASSWHSLWVLARKDISLLLRDRRSALLLLVMPIIFILVLGMALGETFGQKPDDRLQISIVDQDEGFIDREAAIIEAVAWLRNPLALSGNSRVVNRHCSADSRHPSGSVPF